MASYPRNNFFPADKEICEQEHNNLRLCGLSITDRIIARTKMLYLTAVNTGINFIETGDSDLDSMSLYASELKEITAERCFFSRSTYTRTGISNSRFHLCDFSCSTFTECSLADNRISETSFTGSYWYKSTIENTDTFFLRFPGAIFKDVTFSNCRLKKAVFRTAEFYNCTFTNCSLDDAVFHRAYFSNTVFDNTDITKAESLTGVTGLEI